tara:strand:+ start:238 stop:666 length:429 start_codon:yes stop_codon:yes gene_type:complete
MKSILMIYLMVVFSQLTLANNNNYFEEAKKLFDEKKYEKSKFLFERNITYNPKDANSYLYLAKIFKYEEDEKNEEKNINTTLLLDPKNEEATYLLIDIEIKRSNFLKAKKLKKDFKTICLTMCDKLLSIESRLKDFEKKDAT